METPLINKYYAGVEPSDAPTEITFQFAGYLESHTALAGVWLKMDDYQREEVLQFLHESIEEAV